MADFECAVNYVLRNEGGLNEKIAGKDPGGLTNHGISLRFLKMLDKETLKKYGIFDEEINEDTIRDLSLDQAKAIYKGEFWSHAPFERIINQEHANYIFDMVISLGINPGIKCVQHSIWAVMRKWEFLKDDGILGEKTLAALNQCGFLIMPALRAERAAFYRHLASQSEFHREILHARYNRTYRA
jgi:lysozyme family protein